VDDLPRHDPARGDPARGNPARGNPARGNPARGDPAKDTLACLVGARIRTARRERGLSVGALADAAGIGKGSLSEIENGMRNPTLSTLYALAGTLGVPLATLLADHTGTTIASAGIAVQLLDVSHDGGHTVEVYRLRIDSGARHSSVPHGAGVTEHMLVTAGLALVGRVGEEASIGPGEAAQWVSDVAHTYTALGDGPVESVLVIRSPDGIGDIKNAGNIRGRGAVAPKHPDRNVRDLTRVPTQAAAALHTDGSLRDKSPQNASLGLWVRPPPRPAA
jgi:DNA-binding XRE family transcriptional regulator